MEVRRSIPRRPVVSSLTIMWKAYHGGLASAYSSRASKAGEQTLAEDGSRSHEVVVQPGAAARCRWRRSFGGGVSEGKGEVGMDVDAPGHHALPEASITVSAGGFNPWPMTQLALVDVRVRVVAVRGRMTVAFLTCGAHHGGC